MGTKVLSAHDVARVINAVGLDRVLDDVIGALDAALATYEPATSIVRLRDGFHYEKPDLGLIEWMPMLHVGERACIKVVGYHPSNPGRRGLPSVLSTTSLYDATSGELLAVADSTLLTALRTGAASAIAAEILTPERPLTVGVVGCGAQAVTQLHALSRVRRIDEIVAYDIDAGVSSTLQSRTGLPVPVRVLTPAEHRRMLGIVDVLITCTSVGIDEGPVVDDAETRPWIHVNAVGADFAGKIELPLSLLERSTVFPDSVEQCLAEGECQQLTAASIGPSLPELVRDADRYRALRAESTVFDSTGWALEDYVALDVVLVHAHRIGIGSVVELSPTPSDPYNPYELLRAE